MQVLRKVASLGASSQQHDLDRIEDDVGVEGERDVLEVVEVVFELGDGIFDGVAVFVVDLGPAGDAGEDGVAVAVEGDLLGEGFDELGAFGARSDDGHVAPEDVEELGEFVDAEFAEPAAEGGDAGVVAGGPDGAGSGFGVHVHGAELEDFEDFAVVADAFLAVEGGAGTGEADEGGDDEHGEAGEEKAEEGEKEGVAALESKGLGGGSQALGEDEVGGAEGGEGDASGDHFVDGGGFFDLDAAQAEFEQFIDGQLAAAVFEADDEFAGFEAAEGAVEVGDGSAPGAEGLFRLATGGRSEVAGGGEGEIGAAAEFIAELPGEAAIADEQDALGVEDGEDHFGVGHAPEGEEEQGKHGADDHVPAGEDQFGIDVAEQGLGEKGEAEDEAVLLDEEDTADDPELAVEVVEVNAQDDGEDDDGDGRRASAVKEVEIEGEASGEIEGGEVAAGEEQNFGEDQPDDRGWNKDFKQSDHGLGDTDG